MEVTAIFAPASHSRSSLIVSCSTMEITFFLFCLGCTMDGKTCIKNPVILNMTGSGVPEEIRTPDARFRKPTLYPLSYEDMGTVDTDGKISL